MKKTYNLEYFAEGKWSFVLISGNKIVFRSKSDRLKPLIACIKKHRKEMRGGIVFDKVIGRSAAMLLSYAKVKEVWTPVISRGGKIFLRRSKIKAVFKREVENIMNQKGDDLCPMEKLSKKLGKKIVERLLGNEASNKQLISK
jgi:hypothetical protein